MREGNSGIHSKRRAAIVGTRTFYGWFGCLSPETKEVRLNIVKDIIKELE